MADRYFSTTKRGEIHELKEELASLDRLKKKEAVKKVIAAMTVGKDVSMLFPAVVNNMQTEDLELKKLVYLYLINYAKTQPDLAIMAVNTFVKDSQDPNPLIRALAVRTMGCIRVDKITEYLCDPLQRCLKDDDPYVRKTAAICVAKLYDISAELVEDRGFLDMLREMLSDANPMVVANAVAALAEIQELGCPDALSVTPSTLFKLLAALNECTEWGQVFILDCLAAYDMTADPKEAEKIAERVLPRLQHANSAVVLSAVKVVLRAMDAAGSEDLAAAWARKMAPPLVTLLSSEPEVQYVALRSIGLVVQKRPSILANEVKVFFCKYNDPLYVKLEKLEVMVRLANERNADQVLLELKEYAQEVDVDFVRRAVRAIGRVAVALEPAAERCVAVLLELIKGRVSYVVQEAVVVVRDVFRRYPNRYESVISALCDNLEALDEPEAKAAMVWIVGEYAERIDNADELMEQFLESFPEETSAVQLQLLTAAVKLFLKRPTEAAQRMIQLVLSAATAETDNPDLRDRAYVYWRLLSADPEAAKGVVLAPKPVISDDSAGLDPALLRQLLAQLGTLAAVYHRPADSFVSRQRLAVARADDLRGVEHRFVDDESDGGASASAAAAAAAGTSGGGSAAAAAPPPAVDLLGGDDDLLGVGGDEAPTASAAAAEAPAAAAPAAAAAAAAAAPPAPAPAAGLDDLLGGMDLGGSSAAAAPAAAAVAAAAKAADPFDLLGGDDLLGGGGVGGTTTTSSAPAAAAPAPAADSALPVLLGGEKGRGLTVRGGVAREAGVGPVYRLELTNGSAGPLDGFMLQLNSNALGLAPANQVVAVGTLAPGATGSAAVPLAVNPAKFAPLPAAAAAAAPPRLQVALKTAQLGVFYWDDALPLPAVLDEAGAIDGGAFLGSWRATAAEATRRLPVAIADVDAAKARLGASGLFVLAHRPVPGTNQDALYVTGRCPGPSGPAQLLLELRFARGAPGVDAAFKSPARPELAPLVFDAVERALA